MHHTLAAIQEYEIVSSIVQPKLLAVFNYENASSIIAKGCMRMIHVYFSCKLKKRNS